jgi:exopolysaccharide biosynthesis polyprenyl glycosylphosphotransferase
MLPSRLIPGMGPGVAAVRRKKVSSATLNRQIVAWDSLGEVRAPQAAGLGRMISQALLPTPGTLSQRFSLATQVLADFLLIAFGLTFISGLEALLNALTKHTSFGLAPLASSSIGWLLLYGALLTLLGYSERLYQPETACVPRQQTLVLAKTVFWSTVLVTMGLATSGTARPSIAKLAASAPVNFLIMLGYRCARRRVLVRESRNVSGARNVLIVGAGEVGRRLAHSLQQDHASKHVVRGFLDEDQPVAGDVLGRVEDLASVARKEFVDEIILAVPQHGEVARRAIWQTRRNRIDLKLVPDLLGADPAQVTLEKFGDTPVLSLWEEPVPVFSLLLKRTADVLLSITALLVTSPLLAAIALAIKLDSPGPVFYLAPRMGLKGRRFQCCKFRTMVRGADQLKEKLREHNERKGAFFKLTADPRLTRVGRALRRYSLDELPQLWNVLRGEMSLVGPRPHPLDDVQRYQLEHFQRLEITPGLTGLWQVTARRDPSFERSMALDREYIGRWSLGMDFRILCKTIGAVLRGEGA